MAYLFAELEDGDLVLGASVGGVAVGLPAAVLGEVSRVVGLSVDAQRRYLGLEVGRR